MNSRLEKTPELPRDLLVLRDHIRALAELLAHPEPGLYSWNVAVSRMWAIVAELYTHPQQMVLMPFDWTPESTGPECPMLDHVLLLWSSHGFVLGRYDSVQAKWIAVWDGRPLQDVTHWLDVFPLMPAKVTDTITAVTQGKTKRTNCDQFLLRLGDRAARELICKMCLPKERANAWRALQWDTDPGNVGQVPGAMAVFMGVRIELVRDGDPLLVELVKR